MSGGYYQYRCKYFYSHNCLHWTLVNGGACAHCAAEGRDEERIPNHLSCDILVPRAENGVLLYNIMEMVSLQTPNNSQWFLRHKANLPQNSAPSLVQNTGPPVTSATPGVAMTTTSF